jgi:RNA-directed DNA polymerase
MSPLQNDKKAVAPTPLDLYSIRHLEALLGHTRIELEDLAKQAIRYYQPFPFKRHHAPFSRRLPSGRKRWIDNPVDPLKTIQSRIEQRLLKRVVLPEHLLGGVKGKSIADNVKKHLAAKYLVSIDIKNFFPSITPHQVYAVWRKTLNCSPDVAYLLTGLTTYRDRLPQGAPTSTLLANLVLSALDPDIRTACDTSRITYSSWVDDLAFSGDAAPEIIGEVIATLRKGGFSVSHHKIKIMGPSDRKLLNNLVLGRFVTVRKEYVGYIRAGIYNLKCGKVVDAEINAYVLSLEGSIGYLRLFDLKRAASLLEQLRVAREWGTNLRTRTDFSPI